MSSSGVQITGGRYPAERHARSIRSREGRAVSYDSTEVSR